MNERREKIVYGHSKELKRMCFGLASDGALNNNNEKYDEKKTIWLFAIDDKFDVGFPFRRNFQSNHRELA